MPNTQKLDKIYAELAPEVYRYAAFRLNSREEAEDITSETFVRILKGRDLAEIENPKAWALSIARNLIYDKYRKHTEEIIPEIAGMELPDTEIIMEDKVLSTELLDIIKQHLDELDSLTKDILVFRIWEEFSFAEIADIVKLKESATKLRFYRGLEKLKQIIDSEKSGRKAYSLSLPLLLTGIKSTAAHTDYSLSAETASKLLSQVQNLSINSNPMQSVFHRLLAKLRSLPRVVKLALIAVLPAILCVIAIVIILTRQPATSPTNPTPTPPTPEIPVMDQYKERFDLITLEGGELHLLDKERSDIKDLTNTGGKVVSFIISKDYTKIVYTISEPELIEPIALAAEAKLREFAVKHQYTVSPLSRDIATRAFILDVATGEAKLLIDFLPFAFSDEEAKELIVYQSLWENYGISLHAFTEDQSGILYDRQNLYKLDLATSNELKITSSANVAGMCYGVYNARWAGDIVVFTRGCWEWSEGEIYRSTPEGFVPIQLEGYESIHSGNGGGSHIADINADRIVLAEFNFLTDKATYAVDSFDLRTLAPTRTVIELPVGTPNFLSILGSDSYTYNTYDYKNGAYVDFGKIWKVEVDGTISQLTNVVAAEADKMENVTQVSLRGKSLLMQVQRVDSKHETKAEQDVYYHRYFYHDIQTNETVRVLEVVNNTYETGVIIQLFGK